MESAAPPALSDRLAGGVFPRYSGGSILNLPASLGALLGSSYGWAAPPLRPSLLEVFGGDWRRVALLLVDGVGWNRLERELAENDAGYLALEDTFGLGRVRLTSVSPSTTSVATTCLLGNGAAPAEHGMLGYTFWLPALGAIANALFWKPADPPQASAGALEDLGFAPESFLPVPSLFATLAAAGISGRALLPRYIAGSPLSRMQLRGAEVEGYGRSGPFAALERWQSQSSAPAFAYGYIVEFDAIGHRDGPDAPSWSEQWRTFVAQLGGFLPRLQPDTLLLLCADHGHVSTPRAQRRTLQHLPEIARLCRCPPGGEARHTYLYCRPEQRAELLTACSELLSDAFVVLAGEEALAAGLYGPSDRAHPEAAQRLGDVVLLARGGASLWDAGNPATLLGMHGALEPDEMLVPLAGFTGR